MGLILIAYERESEQNTLEQLLSGRGHTIVKSGNGLAALDAARRAPPQLIVSDIVLPRMDGFALCRKWKQDERLQTIPFIFYTRRHDDPKYERFALELGAERFLARSVQPDALLSAVDELLARAPKTNETAPLPVLDTAAVERMQVLERAQQAQAQAHAQAVEKAQQAQAGLREQLSELEVTNQRLAAGEARFRRIFEANPLPMWITDDATGGFIAANDAALVMYGYSRAEFLALRVSDLPAPDVEAIPGVATHRRKDGAALKLSIGACEIEFDGRGAKLVSAYDLTERSAAHAQTLGSLQRVDVAMQAMIDALLKLSEKHDPYTAGSARRIAALAVALGRGAGLDGHRQHALRVAALLHDVGNVAIPPSLLAKPASLNAAEIALMHTHVEEGCKLLADVDFGAPIAEIIYEHHERCDGSGYPRALQGEEIRLEARILAIADVVEAMCSPRPHRPACGLDAALDELNRGAGTAYDPQLVAACVRLFREHGFKLP